jgi:hypothetical protein
MRKGSTLAREPPQCNYQARDFQPGDDAFLRDHRGGAHPRHRRSWRTLATAAPTDLIPTITTEEPYDLTGRRIDFENVVDGSTAERQVVGTVT